MVVLRLIVALSQHHALVGQEHAPVMDFVFTVCDGAAG
jgi:hypothetical protein